MTKRMIDTILVLIILAAISPPAYALEKSELKKIDFEKHKIEITPTTLKEYPFLKTDPNENEFSDTDIIKTRNYIKEMTLGSNTIVLLKQIGSLQCGMHGCPMSVYYRTSKNNYTLLQALSVHELLHASCDTEILLISANNTGYIVFRIIYRKDHPDIETGKYKTLQEIPLCAQ